MKTLQRFYNSLTTLLRLGANSVRVQTALPRTDGNANRAADDVSVRSRNGLGFLDQSKLDQLTDCSELSYMFKRNVPISLPFHQNIFALFMGMFPECRMKNCRLQLSNSISSLGF